MALQSDRFAREIVGFFEVTSCSALAAADAQAVGRALALAINMLIHPLAQVG
jgi:hypothetical protein